MKLKKPKNQKNEILKKTNTGINLKGNTRLKQNYSQFTLLKCNSTYSQSKDMSKCAPTLTLEFSIIKSDKEISCALY